MLKNKSHIKNIISLFVCIAFIFSYIPVFALDDDIECDISKTAKYVLSISPNPTVSSIGGEWAVIGIKRSKILAPKSYFLDYIERSEAALSEGLGRKYTEYSRLAIAISELGYDAMHFGDNNINLLEYINDYDSVVTQGINGPIFALKAKFSCGDDDTIVRDKYIEYILNRQNENGSFGLSEGIPDTDITAMAMSTLFLYIDTLPYVKKSINAAFLYLSSVQEPCGGFKETPDDLETNCESTAQVIIALKTMGLSENNKFFTKAQNTPYTALLGFRCSNGAYKHLKSDENENQMSTEQALLALTQKLMKNKYTLIYDNEWFYLNPKYLTL